MAFQALQTDNADWANKLFSVDQTQVQDSIPFDVALSDTINNNSDAENMDVVICFDNIDPGAPVGNVQPSYQMIVFVEEETVPGAWTAIAESFGRQIRGREGSHVVKFVIQSRFGGDIGQPFDINDGIRYNSNKTPSEKLRVRVQAVETNPQGAASLQSVNLTGAYRLY